MACFVFACVPLALVVCGGVVTVSDGAGVLAEALRPRTRAAKIGRTRRGEIRMVGFLKEGRVWQGFNPARTSRNLSSDCSPRHHIV